MTREIMTAWAADPILGPMLREAAADTNVLGMVLSGSRGAGLADELSDYDVIWILTEEALAARKERSESLHVREPDPHNAANKLIDQSFTSLHQLAELAAKPNWRTYAYAVSQVLLDKTGEVARAIEAIAIMPEEQARVDGPAWCDAYLSAFYRAMKAARRGNELGARLHAAASVSYLVQALFRLERRWPPYLDYLGPHLDTLERQGWQPGELNSAFLSIVRTADVGTQCQLEERVETLMRARGYGGVIDAWGGDLERAKVSSTGTTTTPKLLARVDRP